MRLRGRRETRGWASKSGAQGRISIKGQGACDYYQYHGMERRLDTAAPTLRSHLGPSEAHKRREHPAGEECQQDLRSASTRQERLQPRVLGFRLCAGPPGAALRFRISLIRLESAYPSTIRPAGTSAGVASEASLARAKTYLTHLRRGAILVPTGRYWEPRSRPFASVPFVEQINYCAILRDCAIMAVPGAPSDYTAR
jgi:hypothetical protein